MKLEINSNEIIGRSN